MNTPAATRPARYSLLVKAANGRKWFAADSSEGPRDIAEILLADAQDKWGHTGLQFRLGTGDELAAPLAPVKYRPWAR